MKAWLRRIGFMAVLMLAGPAGADQASRILIDGFDGPDFAESGGLYYRDNFEQTAGTVEFQDKVKRSGTGALKLSIKSLCPKADDGCSERAEIWEKTELRVPYDQGVWYGFSVMLGTPIPQDDHRYLIAQWKREIDPGAEGDFSPYFALRLRQGKLFATVETNFIKPTDGLKLQNGRGCKPGSVPVWLRPENEPDARDRRRAVDLGSRQGRRHLRFLYGFDLGDRPRQPDPRT